MCSSASIFCRIQSATFSSTMSLKHLKKQFMRVNSGYCNKEDKRYFSLSTSNFLKPTYINYVFLNEQNCGSAGIISSTLPGVLTKKQAKELAVRLTSDEREILISALQECQSLKLKAEYENQLAAFRWRSKFGRPAKVPKLGDVDPTGTYCTIPEDWLLKKYAESVPLPDRNDLIRVSIANAIPFIGFGFLDNFVMIIAGDSIDATLGATITISTMAAAALGNTISDILGIGSAYYVELLAQKIGFEQPKLTPIQLDLPKSRLAANLGRVIGVTIGCLLGMFPLLFINQEKVESKDKDGEDKK